MKKCANRDVLGINGSSYCFGTNTRLVFLFSFSFFCLINLCCYPTTEIGCDFGILVDAVDAKSSLGIDKSEESIQIANVRYPDQRFLLCDIFEDDLTAEINPEEMESLVVSIDINGNRELPAVLKCIQFVLDSWSPRLIMVKSRELHAKMKSENEIN